MIRLASLAFVLALGALPLSAAAPPISYEGDVKPIFKKHCLTCHNAERPRGDLDLSTYTALLAGGLSGKAVVAKMPESSPLYTMAAHLEDPKMPPNKPKIPQRDLDAIKGWIDGGLIEKAASTDAPVAATAGGLVPAMPFNRATPLAALAASPVSNIIAVPGQRQVLLFDGTDAKALGALAFPEGEVHALRFSIDGKTLVAAGGIGGQSGAAIGFDTATWKRKFAIGDDADAILAVDLAPDGSKLLVGGPGRAGKVVSLPDGKLLHACRKPTDWVLSAGFSPDGLLGAIGDRFGGLFVFEAKTGKDFLTLRGHSKAVTALAWQADGNVLYSASDDGTVRAWDLHTGEEKAKWTASDEGTLDLAVSKQGAIATAGRNGSIALWEATGKQLSKLATQPDAALKVAFAADGKSAITTDWRGTLTSFDISTKTAKPFPLPIKPAASRAVLVAVPAPAVEPTMVAKVETKPVPPPATIPSSDELNRKRLALKAIDDAVEKVKDEAARDPKNLALAKAYLQLCEASLAMKAEVISAESTAGRAAKSP